MGMTGETEVLGAWGWGSGRQQGGETSRDSQEEGWGVPSSWRSWLFRSRGLWENLHDLMRTSGYRHQHMKSEKTLGTVARGCLLWKSESLCQEAGEGGVTENTPSRAHG